MAVRVRHRDTEVHILRFAECARRRYLIVQVMLQTSQGDIIIDLHVDLAPNACKNFLKLCKCVGYDSDCVLIARLSYR